MNKKTFFSTIERYFKQNLETIKRKNADYAGDGDVYKNFNLVESLGICSVEQGILVRMCDKMARVSTLLNKENSVLSESIADTLDDLSNYSMILKSYLEQKATK